MNITEHQDGDGVTRLAVDGELDMATAGLLDRQVTRALLNRRPDRLVIEAGGVHFCDSSGIHALLQARELAHRHGADFVVTNPVGIMRRTLEITGLLDSLTSISRVPSRGPAGSDVDV
jgi:anti-sigma B factor antagonist